MHHLKALLISTIFLSSIHQISAHVQLDSPVGGEDLKTNDLLYVSWQVVIEHGPVNWDLYYTVNDGITWHTIIEDIEAGTLNYTWVIPDDISSKTVRVRVVQDNEETDYDAVSAFFSINYEDVDPPDPPIITAIPDEESFRFNVYPNPVNQFIHVSIELKYPQSISLDLLDMHGKRIGLLRSGFLEEGVHEFSWPVGHFSRGHHILRYRNDEVIENVKILIQ